MLFRSKEAGRLLDRLPKGEERQALLSAARDHLQGRPCREDCRAVLELFGYAEGGQICVPAFAPADGPAVDRLAELVEDCLCEAVERTLREAQLRLPLTAVRHGVPPKEIANELYHILFGGINEAAVRRGLVSAPPRREGGGRYFQCIRLQ